MYYKLGWPLGKMMARLGVPTVIRIDVVRDDEAGVFVGTSDDVSGLVVEADSLEGVMKEARLVIPELLHNPVGRDVETCVRYSDRIVHA